MLEGGGVDNKVKYPRQVKAERYFIPHNATVSILGKYCHTYVAKAGDMYPTIVN